MQKTTLAAAALVAFAVTGCDEVSLTSPSSQSSDPAPVSLGVTTGRHLVNEGPLCTGARTPGFYCQNQFGKNPNLTAEEFARLEAEAMSLLGSALGELTAGEAVCIKGNRAPADQLTRHLAALALNLSANLVGASTPVTDGAFPTVGDAFAEGLAVASTSEDKEERNDIKDVLDDINNNANIELGEDCFGDGEGGEEGELEE